MADDDEEQRWIEALAGRGGAGGDAARREAEALRAVLVDDRREPVLDGAGLESGLQRLMFRLRRENLLGKGRPLASWLPLAMAASLVAAVGVASWVALDRPAEVEEFEFRGGNVQQIAAAEPARTADAIAADLRALDITVVRRDGKTASFVEALVQNRADPRLAPALARHGLVPGDAGPVLVRVVPSRK